MVRKIPPKHYSGAVGCISVGGCPMPLHVDPYDYCQFGCIHCYANDLMGSIMRAFYQKTQAIRCANINHVIAQFESAYKAEKRLSKVPRMIQRRMPIRMSAKTDAFQPIEREKGVSLKFLRFIAQHDQPIVLSTKSDLIAEPKYFKVITELSSVLVQETIITSNDTVGRMLEVNAPPSSIRLKTLKQFHDVGIRTAVRIQPIFPNLNSGAHMLKTIDWLADKVDNVTTQEGFIMSDKQAAIVTKRIRSFSEKHGLKYANYDILRAINSTGSSRMSVSGKEIAENADDARSVSFSGKMCNLQWGFVQHVAAKRMCHKLKMSHNVDLPYHHIISDYSHCCGGDGLKGFDRLSFLSLRGWVKETQRLGEARKEDLFRFESFGDKHYSLMNGLWNSGDLEQCIGIRAVKEVGTATKVMFDRKDPRLHDRLTERSKAIVDSSFDLWQKTDRVSPDFPLFW